MSYSALTDLQNVLQNDTLIALTDDEGLGQVNTDRINECIAEGDSLIDGYCGARYVVPFSQAPVVVRSISVALAIHNLYARRGWKRSPRCTRTVTRTPCSGLRTYQTAR